jgi:hypothetical protein
MECPLNMRLMIYRAAKESSAVQPEQVETTLDEVGNDRKPCQGCGPMVGLEQL